MEIDVHGGVHIETGAPIVKVDVIGNDCSMSFVIAAEDARDLAANLTHMSIIADTASEGRSNGN